MPTGVARSSRRVFLSTAAGGAAAIAAAGLAAPAAALATGDPVLLNAENPSTQPTLITQGTADVDGFGATGAGSGTGIIGASTSGPGVRGSTSTHTMAGVVGLQGDTSSSLFDDVEDDPVNNALEAGVYGYGSTGDYPNGVYGESDALFGTGVFGEGGYGVLGFGWVGVVGVAFAGEGAGVHGHGGSGSWPDSPSNTGVFATCASGGVALDVRGKARFSRSKRVLIAKGKSSLKVSLAEVSASSLVFAVLQGNRAGTYVRAVVPAAGSFTIYLNNAVTASTYVAYFVLN